MKNAKTLLIIIGSLFVAFVIGWFSLFNIIQPQNSPKESDHVDAVLTTVNLEIDYGDEQSDSYEVTSPKGLTVFDVLQNAAEKNDIVLETQRYDFGIFVKSINGYESAAEMSWIYFVNGESGQVAADQRVLESGDIVEWRYIKPE